MTDKIRILTFTDINWRPHHGHTNLSNLIWLVENVEPTLVLLGGDLVDDFKGGNSAEKNFYWQILGAFLEYLETRNILCYFVKGNWDETPEYDKLTDRNYKYVKEISNKLVPVSSLRVYGIPHVLTHKRSTMKEIKRSIPQPVDIILTHAEGRRRIWLFELDTKVIITGHFDEKLCIVRNKVFISLSHFPGQYAVIEYEPDRIDVAYFRFELSRNGDQPLKRYETHFIDGIWTWKTNQPDSWYQYGLQMEALLALKERENSLSLDEKREAISRLLNQGVYKQHILEYISGAYGIFK